MICKGAVEEVLSVCPRIRRAEESALTLIGYLAFPDPPQESAAPALKSLAELGVSTGVPTGDNEGVTNKICRESGFKVDLSDILSGVALEAMNDQEQARVVEKTQLFAEPTPAHKPHVTAALKANGHVVSFMGDGINNAAPLRTAHIGISVASGADIAKEAADIIPLEKSLVVLVQGMREGRRLSAGLRRHSGQFELFIDHDHN